MKRAELNAGSQTFKKRTLSLMIGLCFSGFVYAQSGDGSIYGQAKAGANVTLTSPDSGASRQTTVDANGSFSFSKLPPGKYELVSDGVKRAVIVTIGTGTRVQFDNSLDRVDVVATRITTPIDFSSVESTTVFTAEQIQAIPVGRSPTAVAQLAPGVVLGDAGLGAGNLPSFGGASVAENGYYINGFDVTNIRNFLSYADLPFEAISQQQIKTGGYGAEYGRSLGGVISLVTKRGTNEWKSGASAYWSPSALRAKGKNQLDKEPTRPGVFQIFAKDDTREGLTYNVFAGGPIVKDKLFVFGLVEFSQNKSVNYGQTIATETRSDIPNGMLKVDWQPNSTNLFELTAIQNRHEVDIIDYTNRVPYSTSKDGVGRNSVQYSGGSVYSAKYTNYLTNNLTVSALLGRVDDQVAKTLGARRSGLDCPVVLDVNLAEIGCWTGPFPGVGDRDPKAPDDSDKRRAGRFDVEWVLGNHTFRGGYDGQRFTSSAAGGSSYTGGVYWRYFVTPASGAINGVANAAPPGTQFVRGRILQATSGKYLVENTAWYLEDSWNVSKNVLLYAGVRSESFDNKNGDNVSFVKADDLIAPRLGFSWNVGGTSTLKIFGNAGSYFIPVASNTNIRATRGELFTQNFYRFASRDPITQAPVGLGPALGVPQVVNDGTLPLPATIADTTLKPMSQDEFILGFQHALNKNWNVGMKATNRKIKNGFDDFCDVHSVVSRYLESTGVSAAAAKKAGATTAGCILMNPGRAVSLMVDVGANGVLRNINIPASFFDLAPYKRTYQSLEFSFERPWDGKYSISGSYTWSKSRGTAEGYVSSIINQEDAGVTQDFDFASLTKGSDGFLPNDRRHAFKVFGSYGLTQTIRLGGNLNATSGRPLSCIGFVPRTVPDYATAVNYTTASSYYCLNSTGSASELVPRGSVGRTPWTYTFDAQVSYMPVFANKKLTLQLDVFNLFNSQKAVEFQETRDFSRDGTNSTPGQLNQNYGQPAAYQSARSMRFTARYEF